ncbi:MAG: class II SORL domain-containing protein [Candidatus Omnitrophica bacterium]|nr:class II SORL domain-containing protein [Candidatus Omnitrophota bacterium]
MATAKDLVQSADWKTEKHVPVIEAADTTKKGEALDVKVTVGKEISHPNTTEHYIAWISVYFLADGEKFSYQIARTEFASHGASAQGANTSGIYTQPSVNLTIKTEKSGSLTAISYCNIHGLWESTKKVTVE